MLIKMLSKQHHQINTLFNTRDPLPRVVAEEMDRSEYLEDITNVMSTSVSKNSNDIYTLNNIKNAVIELTGIDSQGAKSAEDKANKLLAEDKIRKETEYRVSIFFDMLKDNRYLRECLNDKSNIPNVRNKSIITLGVGVAIAANVANYIFDIFPREQHYDQLRKLMDYNWDRTNPLFKHSGIISSTGDEKVVTNRASITETKKQIKIALGYTIQS